MGGAVAVVLSIFSSQKNLSFPEAHLPLAGVVETVALWVLGSLSVFKRHD